MKKYVWFAVLFWGLSVSAFADSLIGFGFRGGVSLSSQNIAPIAGFAALTQTDLVAPTGGIFADLHLLDFFSLQLEANYIQEGVDFPGFTITNSSAAPVGTATVQYAYNYLEVPLLIKFEKKLTPDLKAFVYAGPSLSFLLNETWSLIATPSTYNYSSNQTQYYPSTNWALDLGGGVEFAGFLVDIRYGLGLTSAYEIGPSTSTGGQLNTLSFQAGYRLF